MSSSWKAKHALAEAGSPGRIEGHGVAGLRTTRLILVEDGAEWPVLASARPIETMVIAQSGDNYPAFAARTMRKLSTLSSTDRSIRAALIAVDAGPARQDELTVKTCGRAEIARTVAAHMRTTGGGEIVLFASPSAESQSRYALVALADALLAELASDDLGISLQFGVPKAPRASVTRTKSGTRLKRVVG
jgi:hypothetical protein